MSNNDDKNNYAENFDEDINNKVSLKYNAKRLKYIFAFSI